MLSFVVVKEACLCEVFLFMITALDLRSFNGGPPFNRRHTCRGQDGINEYVLQEAVRRLTKLFTIVEL